MCHSHGTDSQAKKGSHNMTGNGEVFHQLPTVSRTLTEGYWDEEG